MHADHPQLLDPRPIFHILRDKGPVLLHHPYQSFATSVGRFIREATTDPKVRAIKLILSEPNTGHDPSLAKQLADAERDGKEVAVVVPPDRLDDEWIGELRQLGVHASSGMAGIVNHCDAILVVRNDYPGLRRYTCLGTGLSVADGRTDLNLLSGDQDLGQDLCELFNCLTSGCVGEREYRKLIVSPRSARAELLARIEREAQHAQEGGAGRIRLKLPRLDDLEVAQALAHASQAGAGVDLIVPGVEGLRPNGNLRILRVEGDLCEHSRLLHFGNGGADEYFLSSIDAATAHLDGAVGLLIPIDDPRLAEQAEAILETILRDRTQVAEMQAGGQWALPGAATEAGCQVGFFRTAEQRAQDMRRVRQHAIPAFARRAGPR